MIKSLIARARLILNPLMLLVFSAAWIREFLYWLPKDARGVSLNYWAYTEWLIDYSQGFIRRGLSGEIWRLVPAAVSRLEFVAVLSWVLILLSAAGYIRLLARSWKAFHPLTLFGLLFLPSLFFFYLHDHDTIARKEILGYLTILLHLLVLEGAFPLKTGAAPSQNALRRYALSLAPIVAILLPAIILVHEGNFLLFVPLHALITLTVLRMTPSRSFWRAASWTGLLYLPAALAFGAVYLSGTPTYQTLLDICAKWAAAGALRTPTCVLPPERLSGSTLPGAFIPMQWSLPRAVEITKIIVLMNWYAWLAILPLLGFSLWYLHRQAQYAILRARFLQNFSPQAARRFTSLFFRKYFLVPLLCSLPVYFTAYDYGRWFTVTCVNFILLAVSVNLPCLEFARQKASAGDALPADQSPAHLDRPLVFYALSALICVLALILWLPHYCLFNCEIVRSPLLILSHTLIAK